MSAAEVDDMVESWLKARIMPFDSNAESIAEQPKESEAWTEHVLGVFWVRRKAFMEEWFPLGRTKNQVVKRDLWMFQVMIPRCASPK